MIHSLKISTDSREGHCRPSTLFGYGHKNPTPSPMLSRKEGVSHAGKRNDNPLGAGQMHSYHHDKCSLAGGRVYRSKAPSLLLLVVLSLCAGVYVSEL
jgi:hypothetical protein